jgi:uncharacterized protein (TIGR02996 family)
MTADLGFLQTILAEPDDDTHRLIYADWLDEHGDPRAAYLRAEVALAARPTEDPGYAAAEAELVALRAALDPAWLAAVGKCYDVLLESYELSSKIHTIKFIRETTSMGLKEAKDFSESLPRLLPLRGSSRPQAEEFRRRCQPRMQMSIHPAKPSANSALEVQARAVEAGCPPEWLPDGDRCYDLRLVAYRPWYEQAILDRISELLGGSADEDVRGQRLALLIAARQKPWVVLTGVGRAEVLRGWSRLRDWATVVIQPAGADPGSRSGG